MSYGIVSLHDVAPATASRSAEMLALVEACGLRCTLLVIPGPFGGRQLAADDAFSDWLRRCERRGHEVALHGWEHRGVVDPFGDSDALTRAKGRVLARGCAEFLTLSETEAESRIAAGLRAMRRAGLEPSGFTPPGWLASTGTLDALRRSGLSYTATQWKVSALDRRDSWRIPALSQRPGSPLAGVAARAAGAAGIRLSSAGRPVRVALHPADLGDARLVTATSALLDALSERRSITYAELVLGRPAPLAA